MNLDKKLTLLITILVRLKVCCVATTGGCMRDQFQCNNGQCLSSMHVCDGDVNCIDGSDETGCNSDDPPKCGKGYAQCATSKACIMLLWVCDEEEDCKDGSDELNCTMPVCHDYEFKCLKNRQCIHHTARCDRRVHCEDGSDELNCGDDGFHQLCGNREFPCKDDQHCIHRDFLCDGEHDCTDSSDEKHCGHISSSTDIPASTPTTITTDQPCPDNYCMQNADCVVVNGQYYCNCSPSFTGEKCEMKITAELNPYDMRIVIGIAMALIIMLIFIALVIFYCKRRSNRYSTLLMSKTDSKMTYSKE